MTNNSVNTAVLGRVLGVDLGLRRTGLAISDELHLTTRALENLIPRSRKEDIEHLIALCLRLGVGVIVIGYPLLSSNDEGPMARRARGFWQALREEISAKSLDIDARLIDERCSSKQAALRLAQSGLSKKRRQTAIDGEAARILIEDFIASNNQVFSHAKSDSKFDN